MLPESRLKLAQHGAVRFSQYPTVRTFECAPSYLVRTLRARNSTHWRSRVALDSQTALLWTLRSACRWAWQRIPTARSTWRMVRTARFVPSAADPERQRAIRNTGRARFDSCSCGQGRWRYYGVTSTISHATVELS